jgi:hypothetical protein
MATPLREPLRNQGNYVLHGVVCNFLVDSNDYIVELTI